MTWTCCCRHTHTRAVRAQPGVGATCFSLPVYKDDAGDEEGRSYGKEVRQRHVVIVLIQWAALRRSIGEGGIVMAAIDPAALLQCVVSVVPIIHHAVCKIALKQEEK